MILRVDQISDKRRMEDVRQELLRFRVAVTNLIAWSKNMLPQEVTDKQIEDWLDIMTRT